MVISFYESIGIYKVQIHGYLYKVNNRWRSTLSTRCDMVGI